MADAYEQLSTARLQLDRMSSAELEPMYALHSDPAVWRHLPSGQHQDRLRTERFIANMQPAWDAQGLGYWAVRLRADVPPGPGDLHAGDFIGVGGCAQRHGLVWNVYYRLGPEAWRHGYASEIVAAALTAARDIDPGLPIVAYMLAHNHASEHTAQRAGLTLAWRGIDHGNHDPAAVRLVYSDRPLTDDIIGELTSRP